MNRYVSAVGVGRLPLAVASAELGVEGAELEAALAELARRGLVVTDEETGEYFLPRWWSFHRCSLISQRRQAELALEKVESGRLREEAERAFCRAVERQGSRGGEGKKSGGKKREKIARKKSNKNKELDDRINNLRSNRTKQNRTKQNRTKQNFMADLMGFLRQARGEDRLTRNDPAARRSAARAGLRLLEEGMDVVGAGEIRAELKRIAEQPERLH